MTASNLTGKRDDRAPRHPLGRFGLGESARLCQVLGARPTYTLIVGCEPATIITGEDYTDMQMGLSEPVQAAALEAVKMIDSLVGQLLTSTLVTQDSSRNNKREGT